MVVDVLVIFHWWGFHVQLNTDGQTTVWATEEAEAEEPVAKNIFGTCKFRT